MNTFKYSYCILYSIILITLKNRIECSENNAIYAPKKLTNCKAQLDNGKIIDLSPLDDSQNPK